jgi:pyruvate/2-oxoglutarate/acetoin dehydrogenase E1 component
MPGVALRSYAGVGVVYPSNAADARRGSRPRRIKIRNLFFSWGTARSSAEPELDADYLIPSGKERSAAGHRQTAITGVGSRFPASALELEKGRLLGEVIDLRTLIPLDEEAILTSAKKTGKVIIAHEAQLTGGFGGEIAARVADGAFAWLDAPIKRIAAKDCFPPYAPSLEAAILPSQDDVTAAFRELARL